MTRLRILGGLDQEHPVPEGLDVKAGKVVVSEHLAEDDGLLISYDQHMSDGLTDLGTVLGSGDEEFKPGDVVVMVPLWGKYIRNCKLGGINYPLVRIFGCIGDATYRASRALIAIIRGNTIKPTSGRALISIDDFEETTPSGLYIPDSAQTTNGMMTILEPGETDTKKGDRCFYAAGGLLSLPVTPEMAAEYGVDARSIALIEESHILAVVT